MRNRINKYNLFCFILALLTLSGCKVKRPKEVIPETTMEQLLYDYHIAKAMGDGLPYNENYKKVLYVEDVFQKYGTTEAVFDSSLVWYTRNTNILSKIYVKVNERLKADLDQVKRLIAIRDNKPVMSDAGDSIDVWFLERIYNLTGYPLNNKISFNLPSDNNFLGRDTLSWKMRYHFLGHEPDSSNAPLMAMHIVYENDSIISAMKRILKSGMDTLRLQSDTLGNIKEIKGFVYYNSPNDSTGSLWIDRVSLMRYHSKDSLIVNKTDTLSTAVDKEEVKAEPGIPKVAEPAVNQLEEPVPDASRRIERVRPSATNRSEIAPTGAEQLKLQTE